MNPSRKRRIISFVVLVLVAVFCIFLYKVNPMQSVAAPKCLLKLITGYDCPGCGFQRAAHALLHGNFVQAVRFNFFLIVAIPYLLALFVSEYLLRGEIQRRWMRVTHSNALMLTYVVLFFIWWIVRNICHL